MKNDVIDDLQIEGSEKYRELVRNSLPKGPHHFSIVNTFSNVWLSYRSLMANLCSEETSVHHSTALKLYLK